MDIAVIGTGYVGLVTAACLAESGNCVAGIDVQAEKIAALNDGRLPIYEPGLLDVIQRNRECGRLRFTTSYEDGIGSASLVFLAVGTPSDGNGKADLRYVWQAADSILQQLNRPVTIVVKSTVPVGTNDELLQYVRQRTPIDVEVASNPEFLKEGVAVRDFQAPDRVIAGVRSRRAEQILRELYASYWDDERPFLTMTPAAAEMTKYVANAMLATKVSFINEMARLCEKFGADVNNVREGIGHDRRIGFEFLAPGPGWGGSCFPKDVRELLASARQVNESVHLLNAVQRVNDLQKQVLPDKIRAHFGPALRGKTLAVWGLAFKANTDDVRESPALELIDAMLDEGVNLQVYDPKAIQNIAAVYRDRLKYFDDPYDAALGADALAVVTEWEEFRKPRFDDLLQNMRGRVIVDGRNLYDPKTMNELGFTYYSIGRAPV